jgi:RarD protein
MLGYIQIILAMLIWGSVGVFAHWVDEPSATIVFYRVFFAALGLAALQLVRLGRRVDAALDGPAADRPGPRPGGPDAGGPRDGGPHPGGPHPGGPDARTVTRSEVRAARGRRTPWRLLIISGLFLALNWLFFFKAVQTTALATAVLVYYVAPVLVTLLSPVLLKERLEPHTLVAAGIALIGLGVMTLKDSGDAGHLLGIGFGLAAAFFYALVTISGKRLQGTAPEMIVLVQSVVATVVLAPFALPRLPWSQATTWPEPGALGILAVMGLVHTAFALTIYFRGVHAVRVQHVGVLAYLDPLSSVLFGWVFLQEAPGWWTLAGGALILGATWLVLRPGRKSRSAQAASDVAD